MKYLLFAISLIILVTACSKENETADEIIEKAIHYHGGRAYDTANTSFDFRDKRYVLTHNDGKYNYKRIFADTLENKYIDILNNEGFTRKINDTTVALKPEDSAAYANSVNSVHYFALLPYGLQNSSVKAERLQDQSINEKNYYTIKVSFEQEGGGTDFEDVFIYWFDKEDYSMDYLAYSYQTEGGGARFREAYNPQKIDGIIFQDYKNYKADKDADLKNLPGQFEEGELKLLSKIELKFTDK